MEGSASVGMVAGPDLAGILVQIMSAPVALVVDSVSCTTLSGLPKAPPSADPVGESGDPEGGPGPAAEASAALRSASRRTGWSRSPSVTWPASQRRYETAARRPSPC